jgi:hypothetical protein
MPEISRFFGMIITMHYNDHNPPHFHVRHGDQLALINIQTGALLQGILSPKALGLVVEWCFTHRAELLNNWELAKRHAELNKVAPLE